jgi:hypothetical protein
MPTERNQVKVYHDWFHLVADVQAKSTSHNLSTLDGLRAWGKANPVDLMHVKNKGYWWFMIRRESILINRGASGDASDASRISSLGYLAPIAGLENKIANARNLYGGRDLRELWQNYGPWQKKQLLILSIIYQDSRLSGIIARRAIEQNHFLDAELSKNAKDRYDKKDPANPSLITGSWDEYTEVDYAGTAAGAIASKDRLDPKFKKQLTSINI